MTRRTGRTTLDRSLGVKGVLNPSQLSPKRLSMTLMLPTPEQARRRQSRHSVFDTFAPCHHNTMRLHHLSILDRIVFTFQRAIPIAQDSAERGGEGSRKSIHARIRSAFVAYPSTRRTHPTHLPGRESFSSRGRVQLAFSQSGFDRLCAQSRLSSRSRRFFRHSRPAFISRSQRRGAGSYRPQGLLQGLVLVRDNLALFLIS